MTLEEYDEEVRRRLRAHYRARLRDVAVDVAAGLAVGLCAVALFLGYLWLTPPQRNAECDRQYAEIEAEGGEE